MTPPPRLACGPLWAGGTSIRRLARELQTRSPLCLGSLMFCKNRDFAFPRDQGCCPFDVWVLRHIRKSLPEYGSSHLPLPCLYFPASVPLGVDGVFSCGIGIQGSHPTYFRFFPHGMKWPSSTPVSLHTLVSFWIVLSYDSSACPLLLYGQLYLILHLFITVFGAPAGMAHLVERRPGH